MHHRRLCVNMQFLPTKPPNVETAIPCYSMLGLGGSLKVIQSKASRGTNKDTVAQRGDRTWYIHSENQGPQLPAQSFFNYVHDSIAFHYFRKRKAVADCSFIPAPPLLQSFIPDSVVDYPLCARHTIPGACDTVVNQQTKIPVLYRWQTDM